jgi:hypothetical protein
MKRNSKLAKIASFLRKDPDVPVTVAATKFGVDKQYIYNVRYIMRKRKNATPVAPNPLMDTPDPQMPKFQPKDDPVNHPKHYTDGGIETIDFIEAKRLGYHLGNVVKYICRAGKKGTNMGLQDLQKARWYLDRAIEKNEINPPTR